MASAGVGMVERRRALIYIRKSVVRTGSDTVSPERQKAACLAEAERHGWTVADGDVYVDADGHLSGRSENRPGWQAMLTRLRRDPAVAAVVVESLSRASRSLRGFLDFIDECKGRDVALVSLKERFDTSTAMGGAMLAFCAIINQLESDLASERMTAQIAFRKAGGRHWGLTPFGCSRVKETGALVPNLEEYVGGDGMRRTWHETLQRAYELYATGGYGLRSLASALNREGHRCRDRDGAPRLWNSDCARACLALAPVYGGRVPLRGALKGRRPVEYVPGNYEPVLPLALCQEVERVYAARQVSHKPAVRNARGINQRNSSYLLAGLVRCGECGAHMKGVVQRYKRPEPRSVRYYRHSVVRGECGQEWVNADLLEAVVLASLRRLEPPAEVLDRVVALVAQQGEERHGEAGSELARVESDLDATRVQLERLLALAIASDLPPSTYEGKASELGARVAQLEMRRSALRQSQDAARKGVEVILATLADLPGLADGAEPAQVRELIASVYEQVEVREDTVTVTAREWCAPYFTALETVSSCALDWTRTSVRYTAARRGST